MQLLAMNRSMSLALAPLLKERACLVVNRGFKSIRPQENLLDLSEALIEHVSMVPSIATTSIEQVALSEPGTGFLGRMDRLLCRCIQLNIHEGWLVGIAWLLRPTVVVTSYSEGR